MIQNKILDIFHFGTDVYNGTSDNYVWKAIQLMIPLGAVFLTYYLTTKNTKKKEIKRLEDVRMMLFHFIILWRHTLKIQFETVEDTITQYSVNNEFSNQNVSLFFPFQYMPMIPSEIKDININDVFTILVSTKSDEKDKRQKIISKYYSGLELTYKMKDQISKTNVEIRDEGASKIIELKLKFSEIDREISLKMVEYINSIIKDQFYKEIFKIRYEYYTLPNFDTYENKYLNYFKLIQILCCQNNYATRKDVIQIHHSIIEYLKIYNEISNLKTNFVVFLKAINFNIEQTLIILDEILNIEYNKEEIYEFKNPVSNDVLRKFGAGA